MNSSLHCYGFMVAEQLFTAGVRVVSGEEECLVSALGALGHLE